MAGLLNTKGHETQMVIFEAFERLLQSKGFDSISVSMICKEAGISRATFYYHFKDKFDVSQWHYGLVAETFLFQTGRTLTWLQANYLNTVEFAKHEAVYRECFDMHGYESLFEHAKRRRIETLRETIVDYKPEKLDSRLSRWPMRRSAASRTGSRAACPTASWTCAFIWTASCRGGCTTC